MKVVLHIGTEKTGTTSIQSFLKNHEEKLTQHNIKTMMWSPQGSIELVLASVNHLCDDMKNMRKEAQDIYEQCVKQRINTDL